MKIQFILLTILLSFGFYPVLCQDNYFSSNLPLVFIDTHGEQIVDEPKIAATMGIIFHSDSQYVSSSDKFNNYNGKIAIETRGYTSQNFPKK